MTEETAHQGAVVSDHRHARIDRAGQILIPLDRVASEQALEMRPHVLVRIEVRGVAGEKVHAEPRAMRMDEPRDRGRDVRRMPIEHEVDRTADIAEKGLEELEEARRRERAA